MDAFLQRSNRKLEDSDIHLLGVTSMLMASKMEEIIPFKISTMVKKVTHGKIPVKDIVKFETEILQVFNFNMLVQPSLFVFLEFLMVKLNFHTLKNY